MPTELYFIYMSASCRAVLMACQLGDIDIVEKNMDLSKGDHKTPEFLKMNPEHTLPTVKDTDTGFCVHESRACLQYLADKFSKDPNLYPKDIEKRTEVNFFLFFDMEKFGWIFPKFVLPQIIKGEAPDPAFKEEINKNLTTLNNYLEGNKFITGDHITIADCSICSSLLTLDIVDYDVSSFKDVVRYKEELKKTKGYAYAQQKGQDMDQQWATAKKLALSQSS